MKSSPRRRMEKTRSGEPSFWNSRTFWQATFPKRGAEQAIPRVCRQASVGGAPRAAEGTHHWYRGFPPSSWLLNRRRSGCPRSGGRSAPQTRAVLSGQSQRLQGSHRASGWLLLSGVPLDFRTNSGGASPFPNAFTGTSAATQQQFHPSREMVGSRRGLFRVGACRLRRFPGPAPFSAAKVGHGAVLEPDF